MIEKAGVISVKNESDLKIVFESLTSSQSLRESFGSKNANFIKGNKGAVVQIMDYLRI